MRLRTKSAFETSGANELTSLSGERAVVAQYLALPVDEMYACASFAGDPLVIVLGRIPIVVQPMLDLQLSYRAGEEKCAHQNNIRPFNLAQNGNPCMTQKRRPVSLSRELGGVVAASPENAPLDSAAPANGIRYIKRRRIVIRASLASSLVGSLALTLCQHLPKAPLAVDHLRRRGFSSKSKIEMARKMRPPLAAASRFYLGHWLLA